MIRFRCDGCGRGLRVSQAHAGKKGRCPKCAAIVRVPRCVPDTMEAREPVATSDWQHGELRLKRESRPTASSPPAPDWATERIDSTLPQEQPAEDQGARKYPWPIDILLYPANVPGLINLLIFWFVLPLATGILGIFASFIPLVGWIILIILSLLVPAYIMYYLANCIRDSAQGGTRAPENMNDNPNPGGALGHLLEIFAVIVVVLAPAVLTYLHFRQMNGLFWICVGVGSFVLPMALLAVIMFESVSGFNPFMWIMSICATLIPYLGLVTVFAGLTVGLLLYIQMTHDYLLQNILVRGALIYIAMIFAHILGRFYYRLDERLRWGP